MPETLPSHARVVIVGGGIIGCSVAYHLTKLGWRDVVLIEQGRLTCGTTWHAAGLVGQMRPNRTMTRMSRYGIELYATLEQETGLATGWKQCGSLNVAKTAERLKLIKRQMARAKGFGVEFEFISPAEAQRMLSQVAVYGLAVTLEGLAAVAGRQVCVAEGTLWIRGTSYGPVYAEAQGQPMPHLAAGCFTVEAGRVFLASQAKQSLDSRYYGSVATSDLWAVATPLWVWR